ncbi:hypothetical protein WICPIJ_009486 [Wickerhamomyces pijperi]|uniref:Exoribonuclease phosphorolytic domain-containing protein n=1 Tax=Wickerhamomyces pijperi TaxID=599730 RepID=A0A9P8PNR8_WICPI|nr:hypothetical protein WICPIJ_009486 [Wickerhamomyces pijperi]
MSTQDRRRILPPSNAKPLVFSQVQTNDKTKDQSSKTNTDISTQVSQTFLKTGLITSANGSSFLECQGNIINVSIYGPRPTRGSFVEKTTIDVQIDDNTKELTTLMNKKLAGFVENVFSGVVCLEKYPKSGISIFINLLGINDLKNNGLMILSLICQAVTLALIDSGIEVIDIVSSTFDQQSNTVGCFIKQGEIVGILSDSNLIFENSQDFKNILNRLDQQSKVVKNSIVQFLIQQQQQK